jgi:colicin import membrane protein
MLAVFRRNPKALLFAILLHLLLVVFLVIEFDWRDTVKPIGGDVQVVQAELVARDPYEVERERRQAEAERQAIAQERAEALRREQEQAAARKAAEEKARAEAEKARQAEIARKVALEQKKKEEQQRREAEEKRQREAAEREARRKAEAEAEAKAAAEAKARAERERQARIEREKAEQARKAREAAEARARAEREAREAELAAQFEAEQDASELARISGLIREKVERNWTRPPGTDGLKCTVSVRLGANGSVLLVDVVESSGNAAFDRSVEAAVLRADPLPMPESPRLMAEFRKGLTFIFDPSGS